MIRLVVIVLLNFGFPFNQFYQFWEQIAKQSPNIHFIFTTSHEQVNLEECEQVFLPSGKVVYWKPPYRLISLVQENYEEALIIKTWNALEYAIEKYQPDFILRTNACSIWNWNRYLHELETLPRSNVYAGVINRHLWSPFVSGAGITMTPDVAKQLIPTTPTEYKKHCQVYVDDVYIGIILLQKHIACMPFGTRLDFIRSEPSFYNQIKNYFHVRFHTDNRSIDIEEYRKILYFSLQE